MKKKITAVALLVIQLSLAALGSAAYFTAEGRATNVISTNAISMTIQESGEFTAVSDGVYELPSTLMPSQTANQEVSIKNDGPEPFYTRVKVAIDIRDSSGQTMDDQFDQYVGLNFQPQWVESGGWYYYDGDSPDVAVNSSTSPIFTRVMLKPEAPNELKNAKISIIVTAQAVQTKNNPIPTGGVVDIPGWPSAS